MARRIDLREMCERLKEDGLAFLLDESQDALEAGEFLLQTKRIALEAMMDEEGKAVASVAKGKQDEEACLGAIANLKQEVKLLKESVANYTKVRLELFVHGVRSLTFCSCFQTLDGGKSG